MNSISTVACLAPLLILLCHLSDTAEGKSDEAEINAIKASLDNYVTLFNEPDIKEAVKVFAKSIVHMSDTIETINGRKGIIIRQQRLADLGIKFEAFNINTKILSRKYAQTILDSKMIGNVTIEQRITLLWKKIRNRWQIVTFMSNSPAPAVTTR